jgi:hypothetical protein
VFGKEVSELEQGVLAHALREEIHRFDEGLQETFTTLVQHNLPGGEVLRTALDQMRAIRAGKEEQAILSFNGSYKELKEAIKRGAELSQELNETRLLDLARARKAIDQLWPCLQAEPELSEEVATHAEQLSDCLAKETFFRQLAEIDPHARALEQEYEQLHQEAASQTAAAYAAALQQLRNTPGWEGLAALGEEVQQRVAQPLASLATTEGREATPIPLLRADLAACSGRLAVAVEEMLRLVDGSRLVRVEASNFFSGGIESEEQLEQALSGLKDQCLELIGAGKKVLVQ